MYLPTGRVLAFAHRGGADHPEIEGLENTLAAFRHAADLGYDYLETDVVATSDGVLLAFHDDVLDRVSDGSGSIHGLSLAEVRRSRIAGREEIPAFTDLLDAFPDACFNVDIKSEAAVELLAELIAERGIADRVLVGSFSVRRTRRFRRLTAGRVATAAHPLEVLAFRLAPTAAVARLLGGRSCAALQIPVARGPLRVLTPGLLRRAHAAGVQVHVWTVDEPEEMHALLDLGIDGIFTDRTDVLKDVLVARGQWWTRRRGNR
ncbi:glycerophosphodiester phosphodiesterase family protein [Nocardioides sp. YIM 152588]|uniref:glycerophosphodiester phosphodiesterase family protein n=1 Tax=Nocardioides sp. YIM 152588 TaxID=3158259 RepID=UPI0032E394B8